MVPDSDQILPRYVITLRPSSFTQSQREIMFKALKEKLEEREKQERIKLKDTLYPAYQTGIVELSDAEEKTRAVLEHNLARALEHRRAQSRSARAPAPQIVTNAARTTDTPQPTMRTVDRMQADTAAREADWRRAKARGQSRMTHPTDCHCRSCGW